MDLKVCKDPAEAALTVDGWLKSVVKSQWLHRVYIPAGATPKPLYAHWRNTRPEYLEDLQLVQIDDIVTGQQSRSFQKFLGDELRPWKKQLNWITTGTEQAEAAILGLGVNGHVAFHEPGLPNTFFSGCVKLSEPTVRRLKLEPTTWGVTYGLGAFLNCRVILLMVTGSEKNEIFRRLKNKDGEFPALALLNHPNLKVVVDEAAAFDP